MTDERGWTEFGGGPRRDWTRTDVPPMTDPTSVWTIGVRDAEVRYGGVLAANGRVYVLRSDGVSVLDGESGRQVWKNTDTTPREGVVSEEHLYVLDGRRVVALDALSGDREWATAILPARFDEEGPTPQGGMTLDEHRLYLGNLDGVTALDRFTGSVLWERDTESDGVVATSQGLLVTSSSRLQGLDPRTGGERWTLGSQPECRYSSVAAVSGDTAYLSATWDDAVMQNAALLEEVDLCDGHRTREVDPPGSAISLVTEGSYLGVNTDGLLTKAPLDSPTDPEWEVSVRPARAPVLLVGDVVCVTTGSFVFGLDFQSGVTRWEHATSGFEIHTLAYADGGLLVAGERTVERLEGTGSNTRIY